MSGARRPGRRPIPTLTDAQQRALRAVQEFLTCHGFPPTVQELADRLGITAPSAHARLAQLVKKGYLRHEPHKARGLSVLRDPQEGPAELVAVPLVGAVPAGQPLLAAENVTGEVLVDGALTKHGRCFALRVGGASMKGAGIADGDVVIVRQQPVAESGDIVVALIDGEVTVKRLSIRGPELALVPENPRFRPIPLGPDQDVRILGKVIGIKRITRS